MVANCVWWGLGRTNWQRIKCPLCFWFERCVISECLSRYAIHDDVRLLLQGNYRLYLIF